MPPEPARRVPSPRPRRPDCLLIEGCDFEGYPPGGQLATARQMMSVFGDRLALVGIATADEPVGRWIVRQIGGASYWFYAVGRRTPAPARPLVPARVTQSLHLARHRDGVLALGVRAAFLQAPEDLLVVARWQLDALCYCFPGVSNPLSISRYRWARPFAHVYDRCFFRALQRADVVFASADRTAVNAMVARSRGALAAERVHLLPTTYDARTFVARPRALARAELGLPTEGPLVVTSGRLNRAKGWDLLLQACAILAGTVSGLKLVFIGDGEDRQRVLDLAAALGIADSVTVTGFVPPASVARWLQAADLAAVASHTEGWSVAILEALACGKPVVTTDVSGARDLVREGQNGFVVAGRDPRAYADAMMAGLALPAAASAVSVGIALEYAPPAFAARVTQHWRPLA